MVHSVRRGGGLRAPSSNPSRSPRDARCVPGLRGACGGAVKPGFCFVDGACVGDGTCKFPNATDGTPCDDANKCTTGDACYAGVCAGNSVVTCTASDACHDVGVCDPSTGTCTNPAKTDGAAAGEEIK